MLRIVAPRIVIPSDTVASVRPVGVADEIVVVVDVDVVVSTPSAVPAPTATPSGAKGDANAKRNSHSCCIVSGRVVHGWIRIKGAAPNRSWVISRYVDYLWARLLDDDDVFGFYYFCFNLHLLIGL